MNLVCFTSFRSLCFSNIFTWTTEATRKHFSWCFSAKLSCTQDSTLLSIFLFIIFSTGIACICLASTHHNYTESTRYNYIFKVRKSGILFSVHKNIIPLSPEDSTFQASSKDNFKKDKDNNDKGGQRWTSTRRSGNIAQ